jgi:hypothetical protein
MQFDTCSGKEKENELTNLDNQNPKQGPVPKDPQELDIEVTRCNYSNGRVWRAMIRTRGAALKERKGSVQLDLYARCHIKTQDLEDLHFGDI